MIVNVVNKTKQAMQWIGPPIIIFTLLFAVWEISVRLSGVADYLLQSPSRTVSYTHLTLPTNREV